MKKITATSFLVALLFVAASTAFGQNQNNQGQNDQGWSGTPTRVRAPEINPAEAMGALVLLGGAIAIVRGFRRRQK